MLPNGFQINLVSVETPMSNIIVWYWEIQQVVTVCAKSYVCFLMCSQLSISNSQPCQWVCRKSQSHSLTDEARRISSSLSVIDEAGNVLSWPTRLDVNLFVTDEAEHSHQLCSNPMTDKALALLLLLCCVHIYLETALSMTWRNDHQTQLNRRFSVAQRHRCN